MGCSQSLIKEEIVRDRMIDRQLKKDYAKNAKIAKLLLLGAGESGKSTIVKQMKLLYPVNNRDSAGFSEDEKEETKFAIYSNILDSILALLHAVTDLSIPLEDNHLSAARSIVLEYHKTLVEKRNLHQGNLEAQPSETIVFLGKNPDTPPSEQPPPHVVQAIDSLWKSTPVQQAYQRRNEFQLGDSANYFLSAVSKFTAEKYVPSDQDILRTRVMTNTIVKIEFEYKSLVFNMFDVGGQRSQRKKWIHCFDDVDCVLFVSALSEYDQVLLEDSSVNRMQESLTLFAEMVNNKNFEDMPFIVFFNKRDLFEEKIKKKSISVAFPNYQGKNDMTEASDFIIDTFLSQSKVDLKKRPIYPHLTTATDTDNVKFIFASVADVILNEVLKTTGLH